MQNLNRKIKVFLVFSLCLFLSASQFSFAETVTADNAGEVTPPAPPPPTIAERISKIKKLEKAEKFSAAQEKYETLLRDENLSKDESAQVLKAFEKLNMKLLFSPHKTDGSEIYTVVPGDALIKIAKKFGTTVELIQKSNGLKGDLIYPDMKLKVVSGKFSIKVDKSLNELAVFLNDKFVKHYPVSTGKDNSTPTGDFKIVNKLVDPTWYHAGAVVPPDSPKNILGTRWMGFDLKGYGIHGTTLPDSIGKQESLGCIRMHNKDVEELYMLIPQGVSVTVRN